MKRVYFFGAGLSKAINVQYPTLLELTAVVTDRFLARHVDSPVGSHYQNVPAELKENLELLLSYLFSDWPWKTTADQELDMTLYRHLTYEICTCLSVIETHEIAPEVKQFVRYLRSHKHGIVTLNYDTLIEKLSQVYRLSKTHALGQHVSLRVEDSYDDDRETSAAVPFSVNAVEPSGLLDFVFRQIVIDRDFAMEATLEQIREISADPRLTMKPEQQKNSPLLPMLLESTINSIKLSAESRGLGWTTSKLLKTDDETALQNRILKLHGSMDWVDEGSETIRVASIRGEPATKVRLPLIVPPILDKTRHYTNEKLRDIWFKAATVMEMADEIVVVGFSFPLTDLSMRYLFQSALNRNPKSRVVVVNRDPQAVLLSAYSQVFSGNLASNVDWKYCGRNDSFVEYIRQEVIRVDRE